MQAKRTVNGDGQRATSGDIPANSMLGLKTVILASLVYQMSVLYRNYNAQEGAAEPTASQHKTVVDDVRSLG